MGNNDPTMIILVVAALAMFISSGGAIALWAYGNAGTTSSLGAMDTSTTTTAGEPIVNSSALAAQVASSTAADGTSTSSTTAVVADPKTCDIRKCNASGFVSAIQRLNLTPAAFAKNTACASCPGRSVTFAGGAYTFKKEGCRDISVTKDWIDKKGRIKVTLANGTVVPQSYTTYMSLTNKSCPIDAVPAAGTKKVATATAGKKLSPALAAKVAAAAAPKPVPSSSSAQQTSASVPGQAPPPASRSWGPASLAIMNDAGDQAYKFVHPEGGTAKTGTRAVFYDTTDQAFTYANGMLKHEKSGLCLGTANAEDAAVNDLEIIFTPCVPSTDRVKWTFGNGANKGVLKHRGVNGDMCINPKGGKRNPKNDTRLVFYDDCKSYPFSIG